MEMEFGIGKYAMLIMKTVKRQTTEGRIDQPNQKKIRTFGEKKTYKNLEILEADTMWR